MRCFHILLLIYLPTFVQAQNESLKLKALSETQAWYDLLHFRAGYVFPLYSSQVDDPEFFISKDGKHDAFNELRASIDGFKSDPLLRCRFPARYHWLSQQNVDLGSVKAKCPELSKWKKDLNAAGATLIFPASYLNSPSSMFGHTFLRLDQKDQNQNNKLLAYSVNFAANADVLDNQLLFTFKGLTGGYPGVVSVIPYYEKVKEYNNMENRDIWEFELNLSTKEMNQLVNHLWEIKDIHFDYFFFDENCAYRILTLLDVARPGFNLVDDFHFWAIPSDTVRAVDSRGLVSKATYRASDTSELKNKLSQLSFKQLAIVRNLSLAEELPLIDEMSDSEAGMMLEAAYDYTRFMAIKASEDQTSFLAKRSFKLLSMRSKLSAGSQFETVVAPAVRDDQGHNTLRLSLGWGYDKGNESLHYGRMKARIAYHELLDPIAGYIPGGVIEMGELSMKYQDENIHIDEFKLLAIQSLTPRDDFIKRWSWRVAAGLDRLRVEDRPDLSAYVTAGGGVTYGISDRLSQLFDYPANYAGLLFGFMEGTVRQGDDYTHHLAFGVGPSVGYLYQAPSWSTKFEAGHRIYSEGFSENNVSFGISYLMMQDVQLRGDITYTDIEGHDVTDAILSMSLFF